MIKTVFNLILFITLIYSQELSCPCSMDTNDFGNVKPTIEEGSLVNVSPVNHIVDGTNIGKIVSAAGIILTQKNYTVKMPTTNLSLENNEECPKGFRKMNLEDLEKLSNAFSEDNINLVSAADKLNFTIGETFFTTEKIHPDNHNGGDLDAYKFKGFKLSSSSTSINIDDKSTAMSGTTKKLKCVMENISDNSGTKLDDDYVQYVPYKKETIMTNTIDVHVELKGGKTYSSVDFFTFAPQEEGCYHIKIKYKMFDGTIITKCDARLVKPFLGSDADTTFAKDDITVINLEGITSNKISSLHFNAATAPMAYRIQGGALILFQEKDTNKLKTIFLDAEFKIENTIDLGETAIPMAIADVDSESFVIYAKDNTDRDYSYLSKYKNNGTREWKKTIMNNGSDPTAATDQIDFFKNSTERLFGMEAMHDPHNGEIKIGRGKIFVIFAHYCNFGAGTANRDDHTGDTVISLNFDGSNLMLGSAWSTSHSLTQRVVYSGNEFVTSSLGDAFPQQIKFLIGDAKYNNGTKDPKTNIANRFSVSGSSSLISGDIPGNGSGRTCGRLGGLSVLNSKEYVKFAQVYARRPCSSGYSGNNTSTAKDEIGIVFFDKKLNSLGEYKLTTGNDVNLVTSAKYGKNIFVLFSRTTRNLSETFLPANYNTSDDTTYAMLVNPSGNVIVSPVQLDSHMINNDNLIEMADGNVAWTYVEDDGTMKLYHLKTPASTKPEENAEYVAPDDDEDNSSRDDDDESVNVLLMFCIYLFSILIL